MKGSITVEAALVLSIVLMVIMWTMELTIGLYEQTVESTLKSWIDAAETIRLFRQSLGIP